MRYLETKIETAMMHHLDGLIGGHRLLDQETDRWVELLSLATTRMRPVESARYYGFEFINTREELDYAISYLTGTENA